MVDKKPAGKRPDSKKEKRPVRKLLQDAIIISAGIGSGVLLANKTRQGSEFSPDEAARQFADPNVPKVAVPADAESSPPVDMQTIAAAVKAARANTKNADGVSGATRTQKKIEGAPVQQAPVTSFVEQVAGPQETPEQKAEREKAYAKAVNDGLLVERNAEKIAKDKEMAIARIFEHMMRPQNPAYNDVPPEEGTRITQNEYYKAIEQSFIRDAMKNPAATPDEVRAYFNGLPEAEKSALVQRIMEAKDVGGAFGMQAFDPIQQALNQYLRDHPELGQQTGRGR